jgi:hypothetical protein
MKSVLVGIILAKEGITRITGDAGVQTDAVSVRFVLKGGPYANS